MQTSQWGFGRDDGASSAAGVHDRRCEIALSCFYGISRASNNPMHATFFQKVIICAVAGLAAAGLIEWGKVFVEGADKALNGGYEHRTVMGTEKK
jgi:hypothetical protein